MRPDSLTFPPAGSTVDIYCRSSVVKSAPNLDSQESLARQCAERNGWVVRRVWRDHAPDEPSQERTAFRDIIQGIEAGNEARPKGVLLASWDRLSRCDQSDGSASEQPLLENFGVRLIVPGTEPSADTL